MSLVLQSSGGGQITINEPATASNFTQTLPAASGTVVLAGTTPTFNGITFPATQVPSADANTLDDYEEGTWTPIIASSTGSITAYTSSGRYTKIGNIVSVNGTFTITTAGTAGGYGEVNGYPFTSNSAQQFFGSCRETASSGNIYTAFIVGNNTLGYIMANANGAIVWTNTFTYSWNFTYQI